MKWRILGLLLGAVLGVYVVWQVVARGRPSRVTVAEVHSAPLEGEWSATGYVECRTAEVSAAEAGRLVAVTVREGDPVQAGQILARLSGLSEAAGVQASQEGVHAASAQADASRAALDEAVRLQRNHVDHANADLAAARARLQQMQATQGQNRSVVEARVNAAQAGREAAQAQLQDLLAGARPEELAQAEAALTAAEATATRTRADLQRQEDLYRQSAISRQALDDAKEASARAEAARQQAAEALRLLHAGARPEQIAAARAQVRSAEAQVAVAEGDLAGLAVDARRVEEATAAVRAAEASRDEALSGAVHLETLRNDARADVARTAQSLAALQQARAVLAERTLVAPFAGFIGRRFLDPGAVASPSQPILSVVEAGHAWVSAEVDEQDLAPVRPGGAVVLSAPGYPDRVFQGEVERLGTEAVPQTEVRTGTRIVRVRISLRPTPPTERALLKPGMQVHVSGSAVLSPQALLVPNDAVQTDDQGSFVFVVAQNHVHRRAVRAGYATGSETEILAGLHSGEQVVVAGKEGLQEGALVTVERTP